MAASASPAWLPTKASFASRPSRSIAAVRSLDMPAFGPRSQSIFTASSAVFACHQVSATTATALSPTATTLRMPGLPATAAASKPLSLPPATGQARIAALTMPGRTRSMPNTRLPLVLSALSSRASALPAMVQDFGSLSGTSLGGSSLAAASATLP